MLKNMIIFLFQKNWILHTQFLGGKQGILKQIIFQYPSKLNMFYKIIILKFSESLIKVNMATFLVILIFLKLKIHDLIKIHPLYYYNFAKAGYECANEN